MWQDVSARYGHPVVVLNLVKSAEKRPRETILRKEFAIAIAYINQQVCKTSPQGTLAETILRHADQTLPPGSTGNLRHTGRLQSSMATGVVVHAVLQVMRLPQQ